VVVGKMSIEGYGTDIFVSFQCEKRIEKGNPFMIRYKQCR